MSKRLVSMLLCVAMVLTMLTGCGGSKAEKETVAPADDAAKQEVETKNSEEIDLGEKIVFWHSWSGYEEEFLRKLADEYTAEKGVEVELLQTKDFTTVLTAISGGTPPDLLMMSDMSRAYELASSGALMPLADFMERDGISEDIFLDTAIQSGYFDGTLYALPHMGFCDGLYWNKDLFEEAGLDPNSPPKTAEEMLEFANKLNKVDADGNIIQLGYAPGYSGHHMQTNASFVKVFNGSVYDETTGQYTLTDPGIVSAFKWQQQFNKDLDPQAVANFIASAGAGLTAEDLFFSGKVAMAVSGCWVGSFLNRIVPDLDYGVTAIPASEENTEWPDGIIGIAYNPHCIPTKSSNPEGAWDFMKYMIMNKETVARFSDVSANLSHLKDTDTEFTSELLESDYFKTFDKISKTSACYMMPIIPKMSEYSSKMGAIFEQAIMDQSTDVEALLEQAQNELNQ